ncbi:MAG: DUF5723 family protein [Candidatus Cyclobacteriaceae bacterium M2_1C_046]
MKRYLLIICILLPVISKGQYNLTLFQLHETVPQANQLNPGLLPNGQIIVGFPGISNMYLGASNSFSIDEAFYRNDTNALVPDINLFQQNLHDHNSLRTNAQVDPLYLGFWAKKNYISFNVSVKHQLDFSYPGSLMNYFIEGNGGSNLGVEVEFDDLLFQTSGYIEYGIGYGRSMLNDRLNWGVRFKYLQGIYHSSLDKGLTGSIYTDPETYAISVKLNDAVFKTAGLTAMNIDLFPEDYDSTSTESGDPFSDYLNNNNNRGYGLDVGASFLVSENIKLYGSVIDLGYIRWQSAIKRYEIDDAVYTFEGVDLRNNEDPSQALLDSMNNEFNPIETSMAYSEDLSPKFYAGGEYKLGDKHTAGILTYGRFIKGKLYPALSMNYNLKLGRTFNAALSYSIMNNSYNNVGLGFSLNLGFFQIYTATDNLLAYLKPQKAQNIDMRFGLNMTFGRKRHERILQGLSKNHRETTTQINETN